MRAPDNRGLLLRLALGAVAMFAFGYLLVPFYDAFCKATGLNDLGRPEAVANTQVDRSRTVRIQFDTNLHDLAWQFRPLQREIDVHPGELAQVGFEVVNTLDRKVTGQAVASYGPQQAARYFRKLQCFCFSQETLGARETRDMPVVFVVDPALPRDVTVITLSYTFFEVAGRQQAAAAGGAG